MAITDADAAGTELKGIAGPGAAERAVLPRPFIPPEVVLPELTFLYDESIAGQDRIEQLLNEVRTPGSDADINDDHKS